MIRRLAAVTTCLALATALAACDDSPEKKAEEPPYVLGESDQYVAFGDSYTSAPGTGPVTKAEGCSQTRVNYPHRIAKATGVALLDHSCNGADTNNVVDPQTTARTRKVIAEPQIDGVGEDTDLITFRMGANDFGLIGRIFGCAIAYSKGVLGNTPQACTTLDETAPKGPVADVKDDLTADVVAALQAISDRAPNARIFVIGYPQILPPEGSCALFPLPPGDDAWARGIIEDFNVALRAGAEAIDATYIDMWEVSAGHDTCSDDPWMAGIKVPDGGAVVFHPYTTEGQAVAELVLAELKS
ncbi:SGNH/GDSL hydrolase family protein [Nocardioides humilatus]|uniref:SGNH/GDSL hydrolase family protein n=1 Tax=Nocardioides humilatus TaxID=2607660 RepID=UPI00165FC6C0|nr:SGNH/GDSL hydrolase family protein [Nocardioides humilatus]